MPYFVYMLITKRKGRLISYVGYTSDLKNRLIKHNNSKGAKFTKGRKWILVFKKKFKTKSEAMKYEYILKFDRKRRENIKQKFIKNLS